jgi:hypothetical protein
MADLQDLHTIAGDSQFQDRCMEALISYAGNTVLTEGDSVTSHAQREAFALSLQTNTNTVSPYVVAQAVLMNSTIAIEATVASLPGCTAVPDTDIEYAITQVFNNLAGVSS